MEKATAVNTCLGVLKGRDCIYLDQVKQDALNNLTFTGDINGHLISQCRDEKDWFPYTLTFRQVLAYFTCELDTYENLAGTEYLDGSSFDLIEDSTWLKSLPVREDFDKGIYRHYRLFTYDDVYNISAGSIEKVLTHIDAILSAAMEDWNKTTNHAALRCPPMVFPLPKGQESNIP